MSVEQELKKPLQGIAAPVVGAAPTAAHSFWRKLINYEGEKVVPWIAARNTIGVALPLAIFTALGAVSTGLHISMGALNVSFSDSHGPYILRVRRMLSTSVIVGIGVFAGALSAHNDLVAVGLALAWAFASGILVALSSIAADLGAVSLVIMLVYSATPLPPNEAAIAVLLAVGGGFLQTLLSLVLWPIRRYAPERRALGELYVELSRVAASAFDEFQPPPATAQSTSAHEALASLDRDHSPEGARHLLLLSEAEQLRLGLLFTSRLRSRVQREDVAGAEGEALDRFLELCSRVLRSIGDSLISGEPATAAKELYELDATVEQLREFSWRSSSPSHHQALISEVHLEADVVAGRLRAALDLVTHATPAGLEAFERRQTYTPWKLRLAGTLALLRANLSLDSAACRHAIRLAASVAIGDALARGLGLPRSYWLPMTVAIVLKPDFTATFSRGVLRLAGTFTGLAFATVLFEVLPASSKAAEVTVIVVLMFMLRAFGPANYGIIVVTVSALIVFLFAMLGVAPKEVVAARAVNTAAGGAIALLVYWLWPTWERTQVPEALARTLDGFRTYFRVLRESYENPNQSFANELDISRRAGRLARTNLEASIDRLSAEPGGQTESMHSLRSAVAALYRLAHALMALEAGFSTSPPVPPRQAFTPFANHVELTLYHLAAILRGSPFDRASLPNLREDVHAIVRSPVAMTERYALVNVEADRIASSLDSFTEELLHWLAAEGRLQCTS